MTSPPLPPGQHIADYGISGLGGQGKTAAVYRCRRGYEDVAVKLLHEPISLDSALRAHVRRRAAQAQKLSHRHLLRVHEAGVHGDRVFVVTAWVAGTSLERLISAGRRASPAAAARTVEQLARAIAVCHDDSVVHGAFTPKAVLIDSRSGDALIDDLERPLSIAVGDHHAGGDHIVRDLDYAAPWDLEAKQATPSGDVYALGCILHALLVGKPPARNGAQDGRVSQRVARSLRTVITRAISESPAERYPSALALARDLEHVATTLSGSSRLELPAASAGVNDDGTGRRRRFVRLAPRLSRAAGVALLAGASLVGVAHERGSRDSAAALKPAATSVGDPTVDSTGRGATSTGRGTPGGTAGTRKASTQRPSAHPTSQLIGYLPREWEPRPRPRDRTASLTVDVPGMGWVQITYRAGPAVAPWVQMREQRRRDELAVGVRPLELRPLRIARLPIAGYARRVKDGVQVSHLFRANAGDYGVVAHAARRQVAERLARTASRTIVRPRRTVSRPSLPRPVGPARTEPIRHR
jgi:hypothetical protein